MLLNEVNNVPYMAGESSTADFRSLSTPVRGREGSFLIRENNRL